MQAASRTADEQIASVPVTPERKRASERERGPAEPPEARFDFVHAAVEREAGIDEYAEEHGQKKLAQETVHPRLTVE